MTAAVITVIVAALTAALTQWATGVFGTTGDRLLALITGDDPIAVAGRHIDPPPPSADGKRAGGKKVSGLWTFETPNFVIHPSGRAIEALCELTTMVPRAAAQISPPEWSGDWERDRATLMSWAVANHAGEPDTSRIRLTVTGKPGRTVVLEGARIVFLKRAPRPPAGTLVQFQLGQGCGEPGDVRLFTTDLDDAAGQWRPAKGEKTDFPYTVSSDRPEILEVIANTRNCDCVWQVELSWTDGTKKGKTVVDAGEGPFHTLPAKGYPTAAWKVDKDTGWQPTVFHR